MKKQIIATVLTLLFLSVPIQPVWAAQPQATPAVSAAPAAVVEAPDPEALVRAMTDYMKSLPQFYVAGEVLYDKVYENNNKIQYFFGFDYYVKRPGQFQFNIEGDLQNKQVLYDGKTITIYDVDKALYAVMDVPGTIDGALDKAAEEYGLSMAILNVARSDFGVNLLKNVIKSGYVGMSSVGGIPCHHVAFLKEDVATQLWIEDSDKPIVRKYLVTYRKDPAMPSASVEITDWTVSPALPDGWATFVVKPGMKKIPMMKPSENPAVRQ